MHTNECECAMMGSCLFVKNLHNLLRKKIAFRYIVSELLDNKRFPESNRILSLNK